MIPYKHRFHGHGSLRYLYTKGRAVRNRSLQLRYVPNARYPERRATVIVGKKVAKSAVVRNRIRRRIYEVLRRHWDALSPATDLAITVFSADLVSLPSDEVEALVISLFHQAGLYRSKDVSDTIR